MRCRQVLLHNHNRPPFPSMDASAKAVAFDKESVLSARQGPQNSLADLDYMIIWRTSYMDLWQHRLSAKQPLHSCETRAGSLCRAWTAVYASQMPRQASGCNGNLRLKLQTSMCNKTSMLS